MNVFLIIGHVSFASQVRSGQYNTSARPCLAHTEPAYVDADWGHVPTPL